MQQFGFLQPQLGYLLLLILHLSILLLLSRLELTNLGHHLVSLLLDEDLVLPHVFIDLGCLLLPGFVLLKETVDLVGVLGLLLFVTRDSAFQLRDSLR